MRKDNILYMRIVPFFCVDCPDCPPGMQPKFNCMRTIIYNGSIDSECEICRGEYYKVGHGHDACLKCIRCQHLFYLTKCVTDENSVCFLKTARSVTLAT